MQISSKSTPSSEASQRAIRNWLQPASRDCVPGLVMQTVDDIGTSSIDGATLPLAAGRVPLSCIIRLFRNFQICSFLILGCESQGKRCCGIEAEQHFLAPKLLPLLVEDVAFSSNLNT
jgi:hypothetical protein